MSRFKVGSPALVLLAIGCALIVVASVVRVSPSSAARESGSLIHSHEWSAELHSLAKRYLSPSEMRARDLLPEIAKAGPRVIPVLLAAYIVPSDDTFDDGVNRLRYAVAAIGAAQAKPVLLAALDNPKLIAPAAYGMAGLGVGGVTALDRLEEVFARPTTTLTGKIAILRAIGDIGDKGAEAFLSAEKENPNADVAWAAEEALEYIKRRQVLSDLGIR